MIKTEKYFHNKNVLAGRLQIFDLKQLADMEAELKGICRKSLQHYKMWCRAHQQETDIIALAYGLLKGDLLRHHALESVRVYWIIRRDVRYFFHQYLTRGGICPAYLSQKKAA